MKNKTLLWIKLLLLVFVFVLAAGLAAGFIINSNSVFSWPFFAHNKETGFQSYEFQNIQEIKIDSISYPVSIYEYDGDTVILEEHITGKRYQTKNKIYQQEDTVYYKQSKSSGIFNFGFDFGKIIIKVPKNSAYDYTINTTSGSVETNMGSESLKIETVSGSVQVQQSGKEVEAQTVSGSIKIYDSFEEVDAQTVSGSVKLTAGQETVEIDAQTISGSIKISLPRDCGYEMDYTSVSGSIKDEINQIDYAKKGSATYGNKQIKMDLSTTSGSIRLENWN